MQAERDVQEFKAAALRGDVYDADKAATLFARLAQEGEAEPEAMRALEVLQITKYVSENAFDIPHEIVEDAGVTAHWLLERLPAVR